MPSWCALAADAIRKVDFWPDGQWVLAKTPGGTERYRWAWTGMPKLPPKILNATFFLFEDVEGAKRGDGYGGSGFLVGKTLAADPSLMVVYAITNWHVACAGGCSVIRLNKLDGGTEAIDVGPDEWEFIPKSHDIAAYPLRVDRTKHDIAVIGEEMFATPDLIAAKEVGPGDDVFMVGRFLDADGKQVNKPAVRFGHISMMPIPTKNTNNGATTLSYIIDLHSRDGFSGSPVFVYRRPGNDLGNGNLNLGDQFLMLLGIHWSQFPEPYEIKTYKGGAKPENSAEVTVNAERHFIEGLSGMTCVAPASAILELLQQPRLKKFYDDANEQAKARIRQEEALLELKKAASWTQGAFDVPLHVKLPDEER